MKFNTNASILMKLAFLLLIHLILSSCDKMNSETILKSRPSENTFISVTGYDNTSPITHGVILVSWKRLNQKKYSIKDTHLLEHILVGREEITGEFEGLIHYFAGINGHFSATTEEDHIRIEFSVRSEYYLEAITILIKALSRPETTENDLNLVKKVISNEWHVRANGNQSITKSEFHDKYLCKLFGEKLHIYCQPFVVENQSNYTGYTIDSIAYMYDFLIHKSQVYISIFTSENPKNILQETENVSRSLAIKADHTLPARYVKPKKTSGKRSGSQAIYLATFGTCQPPFNFLAAKEISDFRQSLVEELKKSRLKNYTSYLNISCDIEKNWVAILKLKSPEKKDIPKNFESIFSNAVRSAEITFSNRIDKLTSKSLDYISTHPLQACWHQIGIDILKNRNKLTLTKPHFEFAYTNPELTNGLTANTPSKTNKAQPEPTTISYRIYNSKNSSRSKNEGPPDTEKQHIYNYIRNNKSKYWGALHAYIYVSPHKENRAVNYTYTRNIAIEALKLNPTISFDTRSRDGDVIITIDSNLLLRAKFLGPYIHFSAINILTENDAIFLSNFINKLYQKIDSGSFNFSESTPSQSKIDRYREDLSAFLHTGIGVIQSKFSASRSHQEGIRRNNLNSLSLSDRTAIQIFYAGKSFSKLKKSNSEYLNKFRDTQNENFSFYNGILPTSIVLKDKCHTMISLSIESEVDSGQQYASLYILEHILNLAAYKYFRSEKGVSFHSNLYILQHPGRITLALYLDLSQSINDESKLSKLDDFLKSTQLSGLVRNPKIIQGAIDRFNNTTEIYGEHNEYFHLNEYGMIKSSSTYTSFAMPDKPDLALEMARLPSAQILKDFDELKSQFIKELSLIITSAKPGI